MGFFNTLITDLTCPKCGAKNELRIQYKYGHTRQLYYKMGDTITWERANDIGNPALTKVKASGIAESTTCTSCNAECNPEDYDVFIYNNVITAIAPMESMDAYLAADTEGDYVILERGN